MPNMPLPLMLYHEVRPINEYSKQGEAQWTALLDALDPRFKAGPEQPTKAHLPFDIPVHGLHRA